MNSGPQMHDVRQRAVDALDRWVRTGTPPPAADRLASDDGEHLAATTSASVAAALDAGFLLEADAREIRALGALTGPG